MNASAVGRTIKVEAHADKLLNSLDIQRQSQQNCDVIIKVQDAQFSVHSAVIVCCSDYFKELFAKELISVDDDCFVHELTDLAKYGVEQSLIFMYTGQVQLSPSTVPVVLHAASFLQVSDLLQVLQRYLCEITSPENSLYLRDIGRHYNLKQTESTALTCILQNFEVVSGQKHFQLITADDLHEYMTSNDLEIGSEFVVFRALTSWVRKDLDLRKGCFPYFFQNIRLHLIEVDCLANHIRKEILVREFSDCRDLLEDALCFHLCHERTTAQVPRGRRHQSAKNAFAVFSSAPEVHLYNSKTGRWTYKENRIQGNVVAVATRGDDAFVCLNDCVGQINLYRDGSWTQETAMNRSRSGFMVFVYKEELYVFGGLNPHQTKDKQEVSTWDLGIDCYNFQTKKWRAEGKLPRGRRDGAVALYQDRLYLLGGFTQIQNAAASSSVESYNLLEKTWKAEPNMNSERVFFDAVTLNSRIYAFGGMPAQHSRPNPVEYLDIGGNVWTTLTSNLPVEIGNASTCVIGCTVYILGSTHILSFDPYTQNFINVCETLPGLKHGKLAAIKLPVQDESNKESVRSLFTLK